jgi:hypothetical protein
MFEELLHIMNFDGNYPDMNSVVNDLKDSGINEEQENLIYELAILAFQAGEDQGRSEL